MIGQSFIEDTVVHANGRQIQDWLEGNNLLEYSDTSAQFCMLLCFCGHVNFHYGMSQIADGTLAGYGNLVCATRNSTNRLFYRSPRDEEVTTAWSYPPAIKGVCVGTATC